MTGNASAVIIIAVVAAFVTAAFAIIVMLRDYALKYRQTTARGNKTATEIVKRPMTPVLGNLMKFQDAQGLEHDAIVISTHNPQNACPGYCR